jgi:hypothetical protein
VDASTVRDGETAARRGASTVEPWHARVAGDVRASAGEDDDDEDDDDVERGVRVRAGTNRGTRGGEEARDDDGARRRDGER